MLLKMILSMLLLLLVVYLRVQPYGDRLYDRHKSIYAVGDYCFARILRFLKERIKPLTIGVGISIDLSQVILIAIILMAINLL
jgi:hypothetical protein